MAKKDEKRGGEQQHDDRGEKKNSSGYYGRLLPFTIFPPAAPTGSKLSIQPLLMEDGEEVYEKTVLDEEEQGVKEKLKKMEQGWRFQKAVYMFIKLMVVLLLVLVLGQLLLSFVLAPLLSSVVTVVRRLHKSAEPVFKPTYPDQEFKAFEKRFNRVWASEEEHGKRFGIFVQNFLQIESLNQEAARQGRNVSFGINDMADMSREEFRKMLLPLDHFKKRRENAQFIQTMNPIMSKAYTALNSRERAGLDEGNDELPSHFDWRPKGVVTPVKAQGLCGSCWAFAAVATTESAHAVAHGHLRSLSEQELLDCNLENNACKGGNEDMAFRFIHERGLVSEWEYPYVAQRQNVCRMDERSENLTKIDVAVFINPDEQSMLDWLINFGPVNVGISVPPDMKPYTGGIYHPSDYDCKFRVLGLHALLVVGYGVSDDGVKYWIVKNSWGNTWGQEHGYVNFVRGINACGIEDEPIGLLA